MTAISSIYRRGPHDPRPIDEAEFREGCKRAWHEKAIIVTRTEDRQHMPAAVRMALEALAIGKWGKRGVKHGEG